MLQEVPKARIVIKSFKVSMRVFNKCLLVPFQSFLRSEEDCASSKGKSQS